MISISSDQLEASVADFYKSRRLPVLHRALSKDQALLLFVVERALSDISETQSSGQAGLSFAQTCSLREALSPVLHPPGSEAQPVAVRFPVFGTDQNSDPYGHQT